MNLKHPPRRFLSSQFQTLKASTGMTNKDTRLQLKILYKSCFYIDLTNLSIDVFLINILLKSCFLFIYVKIFETPIRAHSKHWVPFLNKLKSFIYLEGSVDITGYLNIPQPIFCLSQFSPTRR